MKTVEVIFEVLLIYGLSTECTLTDMCVDGCQMYKYRRIESIP